MTIALISFAILLLLGIPIAYVLGMTTIIYIFATDNLGLVLTVPQRLYSGMENYGLLAIPLFMLAGELMNSGGITKRLVNVAKTFFGHYRGGLAYVNVIANTMLAAIIGSATAQIAMMSRTMVPEMEKAGYSKPFSTATTAAAGLLGPIIPPSMMFIIYGVGSGASIGDMFMAGVIPGLLLSSSFICIIAVIGMKTQWPVQKKAPFKEMISSLIKVLPALSVPIIIIAGILSGVFTATEAAAIACVVAIIVGALIYRELKISSIPGVLVQTVITTAVITILIAMANIFGWMLSFEQVPQQIAAWMVSLSDSPIVFLLLVNIFLLLVGMFMDGIAALIILVPIFMPLLPMYNVDPIHFGIIICINLTIGLLTPPVGSGLFIASSITKVSIGELVKSLWPFLTIALIVLLLLTYIPALSLWLPGL
ncbi:TRAP transporter large permease [Lysinibacillus macroides]|uniref:C4-dicarboxylate ABC transporter permease n=1 Tax=Lysinibacillus macroides TaxID=33935 RepID=A0A0M9DL05_9BACI|nr:TRAP transporter large permease [Lysinibacillus macroides]KOY82312.1 C4-dicarboxylate ABC transporter permease [Lysinibacillus macroides]QPR68103.1 TRAP transporter large permease [Lysinibacillus macroides]